MSRIYFHSEHDEDAEVRGWERAYAGNLCSNLLAVVLGVSEEPLFNSARDIAVLRKIATGYVRNSPDSRFILDFRSWLGGLGDNHFLIDGHEVSTFTASLNTAYAMGSHPVKLLARLHGQCEIHCYVEGTNRAWLAGIIEQGRALGIMRKDSGWESVVTLLRLRDDSPIVTSYSVCEQFPNTGIANWKPPQENEDDEPNFDAWYELSHEDRWQLALEGLRSGSGGSGLELKPDNWSVFRFGSGMNGFAIKEYAYSLPESNET